MGKLFFGDNLKVLRKHIKDESVDLVYLDPPFNSKESYNVIYRAPEAEDSQVKAFKDTWHWEEDGASRELDNLSKTEPHAFQLLMAMRASLGESDMMAYLVMMAARLAELHRVLKPSGTLYIHCDPTASHYLKIILDNVFGPENFINEIIWKRTTTKNDFVQGATNWPRVHDTLLHYAKQHELVGTFQQPFAKHDEAYVAAKYNKADSNGRLYMLDNLTAPGAGSRGHPQYEFLGVTRFWRYNREKMQALYEEGRVVQPSPGAVPRYKRYLDEMKGVAIGDVWTDISAVNSQAQERIGYPTQKPLALLERIIEASTKPGDVVLDPFCGCGTAVDAAEKLGREWIGVDVAYKAIQIITARLKRWHPQTKYTVGGIPHGETAARALAKNDPHSFQDWAVGCLGGVPRGKGADRGIDGEIIYLKGRNQYGRGIVSVKAGKNVNPGMIRDLKGVISREGAEIGIFVCLEPPTKEMKIEAQTSERVDLPGGNRPRIQIIDVKALIEGPNIGVLTQLDPIQAAEAAKALSRKKRIATRRAPTMAELRAEPPLPPMPIKGGKADSIPVAVEKRKRKRASAAGVKTKRQRKRV